MPILSELELSFQLTGTKNIRDLCGRNLDMVPTYAVQSNWNDEIITMINNELAMLADVVLDRARLQDENVKLKARNKSLRAKIKKMKNSAWISRKSIPVWPDEELTECQELSSVK